VYIISIFSSCSAEHLGERDIQKERELKDQLYSDMASIGKIQDLETIDVYFYDYDPNNPKSENGGFCSQTATDRQISVRRYGFELNTYISFVHEVGHCLLGKGHDDSSPQIMNTSENMEVLNAFDHDQEKKKEYLRTLFN
jgi:hypothetical protein